MTFRECDPGLECAQYCALLGELAPPDIETGTPLEDCTVPELVAKDPTVLSDVSPLAKMAVGRFTEIMTLPTNRAGQQNEAKAEAARGREAAVTEAHEAYFGAHMDYWNGMLTSAINGRQFTDVEKDYHTGVLAEAKENLKLAPKNAKIGDITEVLNGQADFDAACLNKYGLVFDDQMLGYAHRVVANAMEGVPTMLVGEKGIAKTKFAKFVAGLVDKARGIEGREPAVLSGNGSMMADALVGKVELENGCTVFELGIVPTAMKEGRLVVYDESNGSDPSTVHMRFHDIKLKRPGQSVFLQENGETLIIEPGYSSIDTANLASVRYKSRSEFDPAYFDRHDVITMTYPDNDVKEIDEHPAGSLRLAMAAARAASPNPRTTGSELELLARVAHVTQRLYSHPADDVNQSLVGGVATAVDGSRPAMSDCITPRKMMEVIQRAAPNNKIGFSIAERIQPMIKELDTGMDKTNSTLALQALALLQTPNPGP